MHIVFRVLNFLHNKTLSGAFNLDPTDYAILTNVASHIGKNITTWVSQKLIRTEIGYNDKRGFQRRINALAEKGLIKKILRAGKSTIYKLGEMFTGGGSTAASEQDESGGSTTTTPAVLQPPPEPSTPYIYIEQYNNNTNIRENDMTEDVELPPWLSSNDWDDFLDHRRSMKAKMSLVAQRRAIKLLERLHENGENIEEVINQSIVNGWKGLFPVKKMNTEKKESYVDQLERATAKLRSGEFDFFGISGNIRGKVDEKC